MYLNCYIQYDKLFLADEDDKEVTKKEKKTKKKNTNQIAKRVKSESISADNQNHQEKKFDSSFQDKLKKKGLGLKVILETPKTTANYSMSQKPLSSTPSVINVYFLLMQTQPDTHMARQNRNLEHDIISPIPIRYNDDNNYYGGVCLSGYRPYDSAIYYSPMPFSGNLFKANHDGI